MTPERIAELRDQAHAPWGAAPVASERGADEWHEMLDEIERLKNHAMFNGLLKNAYLNRLAAVFVLSMETNAANALASIEEDIREGFLGMTDIPTSASLFERADKLERRAMQLPQVPR